MKVALVYDRVNKWGGAERVLLALHEMFPDAPLFTSVYNKITAPWAKDFKVNTSFLQKAPFAKSSHELYALLMPIAFESFNFDSYDVVISVTSEAAKGIITKPHTRHICYCLTPTRYLWSGYKDYLNDPISQFLTRPAISYLRHWDKIAATRPDTYIAISDEVAKRIKKYYGYDASVVYPSVVLPVELSQKKITDTTPFLIVSRLVSYKRIDLAIKACNELKLPLIIIGEGGEEKALKQISGPTVQFLGKVSDHELRSYYENCRGFLFPGKEDFGIAAVEAQRAGKPVIAYGAGGALETIRDGTTGLFFQSQSVQAVKKALQSFQSMKFNSEIIQKHAEKFGRDAFEKAFLAVLKAEYDTIKV